MHVERKTTAHDGIYSGMGTQFVIDFAGILSRILLPWKERQQHMKTLAQMAEEIRLHNITLGWRNEPRTFGEMIALLHSEVSEMLEAYRIRGTAYYTRESDGKPDDIPSEAADVLIRLLDMADLFGWDMEAEYERKMAFNRTRTYRHGGKLL